jgi:NAD(P) transhydrogenase subunit alpha
MKIAVPKELAAGERRVALVPESVRKLVVAGASVAVETGAGLAAMASDEDYRTAGASVETDVAKLLGEADFVLKVQVPQVGSTGVHEAGMMRPGAKLLATLRPTLNLDSIGRLVENKVTAFSTDCIPRTTRAQSMDTLSSQATVAGYKAVLIAANEQSKMFPMLMTAAGTILPAKVLIIGAGVAGLQAIATAKRLGATVEAFDTRPVVKEQVESLGGRFVTVEMPEQADAEDAGGYAKEMTEEFYRKEMEVLGDHGGAADVIITTALIGGVKAPLLIPEVNVKKMKPGSVIVDLAAEAGGNCELTEPGKTVVKHGVVICGPLNLPSMVPVHASQMYSRNLMTFVLEFFEDGDFQLDLEDEIIKGALVTHDGKIMHGATRAAMESKGS